MSTHNDPLEQLFSSQLGESFQRDGSTTWDDLQARRKAQKASFWQFSPRRINVFYVGFFAAALSAAAITSRVYFSTPQKLNSQPKATFAPAIHQNAVAKPTIADSSSQTHNFETQSSNHPPKQAVKICQELQNNEKTVVDTTNLLSQQTMKTISTNELPSTNDSVITQTAITMPAKPVKTIVVVQKQQVVVKDSSVKRVTKHVRRRGF